MNQQQQVKRSAEKTQAKAISLRELELDPEKTAVVQMRCEQLGLEYAGVNVSTLKKYATDRGRCEKWEMKAALHSWWAGHLEHQWPENISLHAIDAAWAALWGWKVHAPRLAGLEF